MLAKVANPGRIFLRKKPGFMSGQKRIFFRRKLELPPKENIITFRMKINFSSEEKPARREKDKITT